MRIFGLAMIFCLLSLAWAASPATPKKAPAKKPAGKTTKSASAKKGTAGSKKGSTRKATTWRNRQMAPSPDRYRQIQEALAAKGFLRSEDATGSWNQNSIDALKRFQASQNIESNGKINSLSLIALGLGPKRDAIVKPPPPTPVDQLR
jgi:peptidoglycan hydrolase-like protein with peptidoglycan-binding domain